MKPRKPRRVVPLPGGSSFQILHAGPGLTPGEWLAWRTAKQPRGVTVMDPEPDGPPAHEVAEAIAESATLPTEEEIAKLPRWARVAFAARCARRVLPLLGHCWKGATPQDTVLIHTIIENAEALASENIDALHEPGLRQRLNELSSRSRDAVMHEGQIPGSTLFVIPHIIQTGFDVLASANQALLGLDEGSTHFTYDCVRASAANSRAKAGIASDFHFVKLLSIQLGWTDDTPIPPTVFGPLWPDGPPPGWPADENPNREIELEIDLPDNATDADVKRYVELLVSKVDDVYRAGGGNGLKISGLDITGDRLAEKPSPTSDQPGDAELVGGEAT